jgi:hypothetical protein
VDERAAAGSSTPLFKTTPYRFHDKVFFDWDDTDEHGNKIRYSWSREDGTLTTNYHYANAGKDQDKTFQYGCAMAEPEILK